MKRILALLLVLALLFTGCSSAPASKDAGTDETKGSQGAVKADGQSQSAAEPSELKYYPTFDSEYKTAKNNFYDFWFDIPGEWKAVDKSEKGGEFNIDPGNGKVSLMVYGAMKDGAEDDYYKKLAGGEGNIEDFSFRDGWMGKKITDGTKFYYIRPDGDSYIIFYFDYKNDSDWFKENRSTLEYIGQSLRTSQGSFGNMGSDSSITLDDLQLGNVKLSMSYDQVLKLMPEKPKDESTDEYEGMEAKTLFFGDGTEIYVVDGTVYSINVISKNYPTPRGLKVGDPVSRLKELYGEPDNMDDETHWGYNYDGYELFTVVLEDDKVAEIQIDLAM